MSSVRELEIRDEDGGLVRHAMREFEILGWLDQPEEDDDSLKTQRSICSDVIELLRIMATQGHSGTSAPYLVGLFSKLASYKPLSPLTGQPDEWEKATLNDGKKVLYQNRRCASIFKNSEDGQAYRVDGIIFVDKDGSTFTSAQKSWVPIEFPWTYEDPVFMDVDDEKENSAER